MDSRASYQPFTFNLFNEITKESAAKLLLTYVTEANYYYAKQLVEKFPEAMFLPVPRQDASTSISPLQEAFRTYNTYLWKLFESVAKLQEQHQFLFIQQLQEQTEYINLDKDLGKEGVYDYYLKNVCEGTPEQNFSYQEAWLQIGKFQALLPRHFLNEFSGERWGVNATFIIQDLKKAPAPILYIKSDFIVRQCKEDLSSDLTRLGTEFTLMKKRINQYESWIFAVKDVSKMVNVECHRNGWYLPDGMIFHRLYKRRKQDLADLKQRLNLENKSLHAINP